jgi:hypothetical protein
MLSKSKQIQELIRDGTLSNRDIATVVDCHPSYVRVVRQRWFTQRDRELERYRRRHHELWASDPRYRERIRARSRAWKASHKADRRDAANKSAMEITNAGA